jgi:hypothetical protein
MCRRAVQLVAQFARKGSKHIRRMAARSKHIRRMAALMTQITSLDVGC